MDRRRFLALWIALASRRSLLGQMISGGCPLRLRFGVAQFDKYDPLADIDKLADWGFDYAEPAAMKVMLLSNSQFEDALQRNRAAKIHVEAMNSLVPAEIKVVGPNVDRVRVTDYIQQALERANDLGARMITFGSGDARMVPEGFSKDAAFVQLQEFLHSLGDEIVRRKYTMNVGIEALRKAESNIVNSQAESYDLVVRTNHPRIGMTVDFFHLATERENPEILRKAAKYVFHIHISDPTRGREFPHRDSMNPGYAPFFLILREINYAGRMSLEALTTNFPTDAQEGLATVRTLYQQACTR